jgi:hypothetical protein
MTENKNSEYRMKPVRLQKIEDYLKLVGMRIAIYLKERDTVLKSDGIDSAIVQDLSDTGTYLILKQVKIRRWFFFSKHLDRYSLPLSNIDLVEVVDRMAG